MLTIDILVNIRCPFAKWVAESNPKLKDAVVLGTEKFIKTYMVNLNNG